MDPTQLTIGAVAIILVAIVGIYFAQARERARVDKIRKINVLQERHNRLTRLLHELPPQYLSNDLRIMVTQRDIETLDELAFLKPDPRIEPEKAKRKESLATLREKEVKFKPVAIRDENQAKEVRGLLEVLFRFVENLEKNRKMQSGAAKKHLVNINYLIAQSKADFCNTKAQQAQQAGKLRLSIHALHNAIQALKPVASNPVAAKAIANYKIKIKELDAMAEGEKQSGKNLQQNDEWDDFMDKEKKEADHWKKKNAYDD